MTEINNQDTCVIYHSADYDGIFCREIAKKFLPNAKLIGWDFGQPKIDVSGFGQVYILDLSPECVTGLDYRRLIWIDHHKSAMEKYDLPLPKSDFEAAFVTGPLADLAALPPTNRQLSQDRLISGYRIDGVSACRLAWQWFAYAHGQLSSNGVVTEAMGEWRLPEKREYVERIVIEPLAVRLAGEYDIWDKRDPDAELFQHGLRSRDLNGWWEAMLSDEATASIAEIENRLSQGSKFELLPNGNIKVPGLGDRVVASLLKRGEAIAYARAKEYEEVILSQGFAVDFEGLRFLACNSHELDIRSHLFEAGIKPEHDALLGFTWTGSHWRVSLYGVPGKPDIDLSVIAVKHGGGGHKQACGFVANSLPFIFKP